MTHPHLSQATLVSHALARCGVHANPPAIVQACRGALSLPAIAEHARGHGLEAAIAELQPGDLAFVAEGALLAWPDGDLALVTAQRPGAVVVETSRGETRLLPADGAAGPRFALELAAPLRDGRTLLARLARRLGSGGPARRATALFASLAVVLVLLGLSGPLLTHAALGAALPDRAARQLQLVTGLTLLVGVQIAYVGWLRRRALLYLTTMLSRAASVDAVRAALRQPYAALRALDVGRMRQVCGSASTAAEALPVLAAQVVDALLGGAFLIYTFALDPLSGAVAGGAGALALASGLLEGRRRLAGKRALLDASRHELAALHETIAGIETIKAEDAQARMLARWRGRLFVEEAAGLRLRLATGLFATLLAALERVVFATVLLLLARRCLAGGATVADLVAALQASAGFMASAQKLALLPSSLADLRGDVERVDDVLAGPVDAAAGPRRSTGATAALVLRDVWFRYENDAPWVLRALDLVVAQGETLVIAWPSGAGKSTLLRVLAGLVPPSRGDVLIHGVDAAHARAQVSYIPQHAALFAMSVIDNLRLLSGCRDRARLLAAAEATGLLEVVGSWGMGLETMMATGNVSSGQRQLILFTAAVASETPIVLLDEALAHVDLARRRRLDTTRLLRGRTVIAVVHDASAHELTNARLLDGCGTASA